MGIVWLASYPKSGNTWMRLALQSLATAGGAVDLSDTEDRSSAAATRHLFDISLSVESSDLTESEVANARPRAYDAMARNSRGPVVLKVHDAWTRTPAGEPLFSPSATSGVVYIARDPRDVAVSFAHHFDCSIDVAIKRMANPAFTLSTYRGSIRLQFPQSLLTWSAHVESWLDAPHARLHVVRYEDMINDMNTELARVAAFIGLPVDDDAVTRATDAVALPRLQAQEESQGFDERMSDTDRFFRRGIAGGWRDDLTTEQAERIVRDHGRVMTRLGYLDVIGEAQ